METCTEGNCIYGRTYVPPRGPRLATYALVGEAPGARELQEGRPFVGPAGRILASVMEAAGIAEEDVFYTNTTCCVDLTRKDRRPTPVEVAACHPRLLQDITQADPKIIICVGNAAQEGFFPGLTIGRARGKLRSWQGRIVISTYHPAALLPNRSPQLRDIVVDDLMLAKSMGDWISMKNG